MNPKPARSRRSKQTAKVGIGVAVAVLMAGSCSSDPELEAEVETLVEFEATWQCNVTRFSFDSSAQIDQRRDDTRLRFGVTASDHKIFTDMLEDDEDLRGTVATRNDQLCPSADS